MVLSQPVAIRRHLLRNFRLRLYFTDHIIFPWNKGDIVAVVVVD